MHETLEAIKDLMDKDTGDGRNREAAVTASAEFFAEFPDLKADYEGRPIEDLVASVDLFRAGGEESSLWKLEAWLLYQFEPQRIGASLQPQVRIKTEDEV